MPRRVQVIRALLLGAGSLRRAPLDQDRSFAALMVWIAVVAYRRRPRRRYPKPPPVSIRARHDEQERDHVSPPNPFFWDGPARAESGTQKLLYPSHPPVKRPRALDIAQCRSATPESSAGGGDTNALARIYPRSHWRASAGRHWAAGLNQAVTMEICRLCRSRLDGVVSRDVLSGIRLTELRVRREAALSIWPSTARSSPVPRPSSSSVLLSVLVWAAGLVGRGKRPL